MDDPVAVPGMTAIPGFPALGDRAAGTYNTKAFAFGSHMSNTFNAELVAVAESAYDNAVIAAAAATLATEQAEAAAEQAVIATEQAELATTNGAEQVTLAAAQVALAASHAGNAATSESAAAGSVIAAAALLDSFDDKYLGAKAVDPTLDNDGNALLEGALYWNTGGKNMRAYDGTAWQLAYVPGGTYVVGPSSSIDGQLAAFDGTTGKLLKTASLADISAFAAAQG